MRKILVLLLAFAAFGYVAISKVEAQYATPTPVPTSAACSGSTGCSGSCDNGCSFYHCGWYGDQCVSYCNPPSCPSGYVEVSCPGTIQTATCSFCNNYRCCDQAAVTPTPYCDASCGTCGYRNSDLTCTQNSSCCHQQCNGSGQCVTVDGAGGNTCSGDANCVDTKCVAYTCQTVSGTGQVSCSNNNDCNPGICDESCGACGYKRANGTCETNASCCHAACTGPSQCGQVFGPGSASCTGNADCPPQNVCDQSCGTCGYRDGTGACTTNNACCHQSCNNNTCQTVYGAGGNTCATDTDCVVVSTPTPTGPPDSTPTPTPTPIVQTSCPTVWDTVETLTGVGCNDIRATDFWAHNTVRLQMTGGGGPDNSISFYSFGSTGASWRATDNTLYPVAAQTPNLRIADIRTTADFAADKRINADVFSVGCNDGETMDVRIDRCMVPKTATVTVSSNTVTFPSQVTATIDGNAYSSGTQTVRMWLERQDGQPIDFTRTGLTPSAYTSPDTGKTYYQVASCDSINGAACTIPGSVSLGYLPVGTYYFHGDISTAPMNCSGNPFMAYEGCTSGCEPTGNWQSCSNNDNAALTVSAPPAGTIKGNIVDDTTGKNVFSPQPVAGGCTNAEGVDNVYVSITGQSATFPNQCNPNPYYSKDVPASILAGNTYNVTVNLPSNWQGSTWTCSSAAAGACPAASGTGTAVSGVTSPSGQDVNITFHVKYLPGPWFQTQGGDVHAQGYINSDIPFTVPVASRIFSLDQNGYPGVVSYGGSLDSDPFGSGVVSSTGWVAGSSYLAEKASFTYFYNLLGSPTVDNFACETGCPTPPAGGSSAVVYYSADNVVIDGNNAWAIPSNTKVVVLVNGSLYITLNQGKRITVPTSSFLAFIVSGNIYIGGNMGDKKASTTPHLEGMYLANGFIDTYYPDPATPGEGSGFRLVSAGLFFGNNGFNLDRNLKNDPLSEISNDTTPGEQFLFRPDLVINSPRELWSSRISWLEVAP